jgi:hypothetical protein
MIKDKPMTQWPSTLREHNTNVARTEPHCAVERVLEALRGALLEGKAPAHCQPDLTPHGERHAGAHLLGYLKREE